MRRIVFGCGLALAGCAPTTPPPATIAAPPTAPVAAPAGLDRVMGQDAATLTGLFGPAAAEVREGPGRKLQFAGPPCVLDAYLYPEAGGEPRVTWVDARTPEGGSIDRASCIAALARPSAAR